MTRHFSRAYARTALLGAVVVAGCAKSSTEVVVNVDTDFSIPDDLDEVEVKVSTAGNMNAFSRKYSLGPGGLSVPFSLALRQEEGRALHFRVWLTGMSRGRVVVERSVGTNFVPGAILDLWLHLRQLCKNVACDGEETCRDDGLCGDSVVPPSILPPHGSKKHDSPLPGREMPPEYPADSSAEVAPEVPLDAAVEGAAESSPDAGTADMVPDVSTDKSADGYDAPADGGPDFVVESASEVPADMVESAVEVPADTVVDAAGDVSPADGAPSAPWANRTPSPLPPAWPTARYNHAMVYDASRGKTLLFGGVDDQWPLGPPLNDLWEWDGTTGTWANRTPSPLPPAWPSPRAYPAVTYDAGRARVVIFGGYVFGGPTYNEVWEWSGTSGTWTNRTPASIPPAWPSKRTRSAITYDETRGRTLLFGGVDADVGVVADIWEWDGAAGTWGSRTPSPLPASWPTARAPGPMVYDVGRGRAVMFAGYHPSIGALDDLWEWNGTAGTWAKRIPSPSPSARQQHAMAFDVSRGRAVLFGGWYGSVELGDLWDWDGAGGAWANRTPSPLPALWPTARYNHAMAYDPTRGKVVAFGGTNNTTAPNGSQDVWEWDGSAP